MTEVVAAFIRKGGRILAFQRPSYKARPLLWEFVGGKVESGETHEEALMRECREELDAEVRVGSLFYDVVHTYPDLQIHLSLYHTEIVSGSFRLNEHVDSAWIPVDRLSDYPFCPADEEIIKMIQTRYGDAHP